MYYAERALAPEAPYAALCAKITASKEKIEYNNQKISDIKAANNIQDEEITDLEPEVVESVAEIVEEQPTEPETPAE